MLPNDFRFPLGTKLKSKNTDAIFEVVLVTDNGYRLKNLSSGCLDKPSWYSNKIVHLLWEPCDLSIKVLFSKQSSRPDGSPEKPR